MSVISYNGLVELVERGVITNVIPEQINGASIDVTLSDLFFVETAPSSERETIVFAHRDNFCMTEVAGGVTLAPGAVALAATRQKFFLPDNVSAEFKLKSSSARRFLEHMNAGWCDPWWHGSALTLELKNMLRFHSVKLSAGDSVGQVIFYSCDPVPRDRGYAVRGRYNNDSAVTAVKP